LQKLSAFELDNQLQGRLQLKMIFNINKREKNEK